MIDKKYSILSLTFISIFLLISAFENDCEENVENEINGAYRFLNYTKPLRYQIYIDPCISDGNFSGYVHIDLVVLNPTKYISLHSQELEFCEEGVYLTLKGSITEALEVLKSVSNIDNSASLFLDADDIYDSSETIKPTEYMHHKKEQTVTMKFKEFLKPGKYSLEINYIGTINSNSVGIYRKTYKDHDGENRVMLLTNFFPTSARRIFPCRDEPATKAEIYFTMQTSLNFTTIMSATPKNYIEYKEGQRWMHYHPIANYSTYQLNFAILCNMKNVTTIAGNKTYIIYGDTSDLKSTKIIQEIYEKAMVIMEDYTKLSYPLKSFINLIIPQTSDATSSASLGFITTKKDQTIYNERLGPLKKKDVILQASRDIASQWFNQLISPISWNYMWLNEGLTEYMKYYLADQILPNWRFKEIFVVWELQRRSFIPNKITDSPPLNKKISENPKEIQNIFNQSISSTSMGASLIRMMSHFLSENVFQSGIVKFLKINKYHSVEPNDLWTAIQDAIIDSKDTRLTNISVSDIMATWTNTEFYPVVKISRNYTNGLIQVSQIPAVKFFGLTDKNVTDKWWIPLSYATQTNLNFNVTFPSHWLNPAVKTLEIEDVDSNDWVIFNIQQTGYYRVLYDEENWKRLALFLNSDNYYKISTINRAQILNDAVQFALKRHLDMSIFLDLVSYLNRETDYIPWYDAQFIFSFMNYHLSNTRAYESLKKFCLHLITPLVDKIGYEDRPGDDFSTLMLRRISNHWACHFGYDKCWNNATEQLGLYLNNKKSNLASVDLQEWARCVGLNGANETIWNKMLKKYQETLSEYTLIYLACSENMTILNNFLNMTTFNKSVIPENQVLSVFKSVCLYPSGDSKRINLCLNFIDQEFDKIQLRLNSTDTFTYFLDLLASEIRQNVQLEQFKKTLAHKRAAFALNKLGARMKQTENRVQVFEQKATYYEPYLIEKIAKFS